MVGPLLRPDTWDDPPDALAQRVLRGGLVINSERNDYYLAPENLEEEQQFVRYARLQSGEEVTIFSTSVTAYVPPPTTATTTTTSTPRLDCGRAPVTT